MPELFSEKYDTIEPISCSLARKEKREENVNRQEKAEVDVV